MDSVQPSTVKNGRKPSKNIRGELEKALTSKLNFQGSFSFSKTFQPEEAPNPFMHLKDVGTIGSPLSPAEAQRVIGHCKQAPFGHGEKLVVDASVRHTWEMEASEVSFENPKWQSFVDEAVKEVCKGLGVSIAVSKPRCELYKLLVYETGSLFLPHQDTEKANGMFATMIIVLPSRFEGGAAHLAHDGKSVIIDSSTNSCNSTTVMAWYTDVMHEIKPITSGYRLALSYNLIHTANTLQPSAFLATTNPFDHIFWSWSRTVYKAPNRIYYLLNHEYTLANFKGSALKGSDAHKVAAMKAVADKYGIQLALATLEYRVAGTVADWGRGPGFEEDFEPDEEEISIENVVDLDGKVLCDAIEIFDEDPTDDEKVGMIPEDLLETLKEGEADEEEYEGYMGNEPGNLNQWYRRTILILYPKMRSGEVTDGDEEGETSTYAMETLEASTSSSPNPEELQIRNYMLASCKAGDWDDYDALGPMCKAAVQWRDAELWTKGFKICSPGGFWVIHDNVVEDALVALGPDVVLSSFQRHFKKVKTASDRQDYFRWLESFQGIPEEWIAEQRAATEPKQPIPSQYRPTTTPNQV